MSIELIDTPSAQSLIFVNTHLCCKIRLIICSCIYVHYVLQSMWCSWPCETSRRGKGLGHARLVWDMPARLPDSQFNLCGIPARLFHLVSQTHSSCVVHTFWYLQYRHGVVIIYWVVFCMMTVMWMQMLYICTSLSTGLLAAGGSWSLQIPSPDSGTETTYALPQARPKMSCIHLVCDAEDFP